MVYNAMKLFMEVNPTLFDECSNQYREDEEQKIHGEREREARWERLKALAGERKDSAATGADGLPDKLRGFDKLRLSDDASSVPVNGAVR